MSRSDGKVYLRARGMLQPEMVDSVAHCRSDGAIVAIDLDAVASYWLSLIETVNITAEEM